MPQWVVWRHRMYKIVGAPDFLHLTKSKENFQKFEKIIMLYRLRGDQRKRNISGFFFKIDKFSLDKRTFIHRLRDLCFQFPFGQLAYGSCSSKFLADPLISQNRSLRSSRHAFYTYRSNYRTVASLRGSSRLHRLDRQLP